MELVRIDGGAYTRLNAPENRTQPSQEQEQQRQQQADDALAFDQNQGGILPALQTNAATYPATVSQKKSKAGQDQLELPSIGPKQSFDLRELKRMGEIECQSCANRKYQDGSNDPGVSYQAPTHISPENSSAAVRAHEQEHVSRERVKAQQSGRQVVSQTVQIYTSCCPECGKVYVSGGKTTTATRDKPEPIQFETGSQFKAPTPAPMPQYEPPQDQQPAAAAK